MWGVLGVHKDTCTPSPCAPQVSLCTPSTRAGGMKSLEKMMEKGPGCSMLVMKGVQPWGRPAPSRSTMLARWVLLGMRTETYISLAAKTQDGLTAAFTCQRHEN
eukprot:328251-Pelagomonas_calceolata.AAC.6